jgi:hypothetical protein
MSVSSEHDETWGGGGGPAGSGSVTTASSPEPGTQASFSGLPSHVVVQGTQGTQGVIPDSLLTAAQTKQYPKMPQEPKAQMPPGSRKAHDLLKPAFAKTFPNVHRFYNAKSRAICHVGWQWCAAEEIWAILTCKFLGSGKQDGMSWYSNHVTKFLFDLLTRALSSDPCCASSETWRNLVAIPWKDWTSQQFTSACASSTVLERLRSALASYNIKYPIYIKIGLFEDATSTQIDTCRLAALMVEPCMFAFLAAKCCPGQTRTHIDNDATRAKAVSEACMIEIARLHNDINFVPIANADIAFYSADFFVSTAQPAEKRDVAWISTTYMKIKKELGQIMVNFNSSGHLANGSGDVDRDLDFWNNFCGKQPMWMFIYLLWDHGRDAAFGWNTILLPDGQTLDIGGGSEPSVLAPVVLAPVVVETPKSKGKAKRPREHESTPAEDKLLDVSALLLRQFALPDLTTSSNEMLNAEKAKALSDHADILNRQLTALPASM